MYVIKKSLRWIAKTNFHLMDFLSIISETYFLNFTNLIQFFFFLIKGIYPLWKIWTKDAFYFYKFLLKNKIKRHYLTELIDINNMHLFTPNFTLYSYTVLRFPLSPKKKIVRNCQFIVAYCVCANNFLFETKHL